MISPLADVHTSALIPEESTVWAFTTVGMGAVVAKNVVIGARCHVGNYCQLGEGTRIQDGVFLPHKSRVGRRVFIGPNVTFTDDKHPIVNNPLYKPQPPIVEDYVSVGAGAVILPGVTLHRGCQIGAGAVVTKDVPEYQCWVGNPARPHKETPR